MTDGRVESLVHFYPHTILGRAFTEAVTRTVKDMPKGYNDWMQKNAERIANAKNMPYFIKDNPQYASMALNSEPMKETVTLSGKDHKVLTDYVNGSESSEGYKLWEQMSAEQKLDALKRAEFTGMVEKDYFYEEGMGAFNGIHFRDKKEVFGWIDDATYHNNPKDMIDFNHYVIKYKDKEPFFTDYLEKPTKMKRTDVEWVSGGAGLSAPVYWAKDATAKANMVEFMGFDEFKEGKLLHSALKGSNYEYYYGTTKKRDAAFYDSHNAKYFETEKGNGSMFLKQGKSMDFKTADEMRGNPLFETNIIYQENCQSCVVAYWMRRDGFNVQALGFTNENAIQNIVSMHPNIAWIDKTTGKAPSIRVAGGYKPVKVGKENIDVLSTSKDMSDDINRITSKEGRYNIFFSWDKTESAHIVTAERLSNGKLRIFDPQSGKTIRLGKLTTLVDKEIGMQVFDITNSEFNTDYVNMLVRNK